MPEKPLMVKAWRKKGKPRSYPTRILAHLEGFQPRGVALSRYGGWEARKHEATGYFRVRRIGERWWMIDPGGHLFLHIAVNAVRHGTSPANQRAFPGKFGALEAWRERTVALLKAHGFNGTGCWSEDAVLRGGDDRVAYTPQWNFMSRYGKKRGGVRQVAGHKAYPGDCIFVFDPQFAQFADRHARQLEATRDDPWLVGHFTDNELPFPRDSLDRFLRLPASDPGRREAKAWLARRKGSSDAEITEADREAWRGHVVETYLRIVCGAIRKHDPNHMVLGPRFYGSEKRSQAVLRAAGKHLDAIAINLYGVWTPNGDTLRQWARWAGKPLLITEWYAKGDDSGLANLTGAGWTVPTQADRGRFYQNFTLAVLESGACVGWHWFKYMDNDPEDTRTDPSNRNSNKGIVTASYEPYRPLLEAMKGLNRAAYPLTAYFDERE
ncbi:MAG: hypothetical protein ACLF0G_07190 [Candidatus Brocadiia bacterium]